MKALGCARKETRKRWTRWVDWSPALPDVCRSAARSSLTHWASNSKGSMPIRGGSNACASAERRHQPGEETKPVPEAAVLRIRPGSRVGTPLCRLAHRLAVTSGWRRYGLAFLLGVCATATLPPVALTPLLLVSFTGLLGLEAGRTAPRAALRRGY